MWSTNPNEPRIPAKRVRENGFVPHLKKYDSVKGSVSDFVLNFSRNKAYTNLRKLLLLKINHLKLLLKDLLTIPKRKRDM